MNQVLMHMSDGLISINIGFIFLVISLIAIGYAIKKIKESHDEKKIPMMAIMGAFVFAAQMINFTIPGTGSSGHIGGGILLCLILGQFSGYIAICSVLIIQCFFFGDGGLLALGCNMFNMGLIPCFLIYPYIVKPILNKGINTKTLLCSSLLGTVLGLELGAFSVVLETLLSGITELPFTTFILLMLPIHLAIGVVEGLITFAVGEYVYKDNHNILENSLKNESFTHINMKKQLGVFALLVILVGGGLSLYASSFPDGLEWSILNVTGNTEVENTNKTKDSIAGIQEKTSILPDYNFKGSDGPLGISFSGIIGGGATLLLAGGVGYIASKKRHEKD